jgi:hypothetical protein
MAHPPFLTLEQSEDLAHIAQRVLDEIHDGDEYRSRRHWEATMRARWAAAGMPGEFMSSQALSQASKGVGGESVVACLEFATGTKLADWRAMRLASKPRATPEQRPPELADDSPRVGPSVLERRTLLHRARLRLTDAEMDYVRAAVAHLDAPTTTERAADDAILAAVAEVRDEPPPSPTMPPPSSGAVEVLSTGQRVVRIKRR